MGRFQSTFLGAWGAAPTPHIGLTASLGIVDFRDAYGVSYRISAQTRNAKADWLTVYQGSPRVRYCAIIVDTEGY